MSASTDVMDTRDCTSHCLDIASMPLSAIESLYQRASELQAGAPMHQAVRGMAQRSTVANLFFENSTRTKSSFVMAAQSLSLPVVHFEVAASSLNKNESWHDTTQTLAAMGCNLCVVRHNSAGMARYLADRLDGIASVINAGDGMHAHPTQALLDVYTLLQKKPAFPNIEIAIIGDIHHSRVARSLMQLLVKHGVNNIRLFGAQSLLPARHFVHPHVRVCKSMREALAGVDVVYALRLQQERMNNAYIANCASYFQAFGITKSTLTKCNEEAIIMHPGPINWGVELAHDTAPCVVALAQVNNGVAIRTALFEHLLHIQANSAKV